MKRLLILGCSQRKKKGAGPALEIYDGNLWRVLRRALEQGVQVDVMALSGLHGLFRANMVIRCYDYRITPEDIDVLKFDVAMSLEWGVSPGWYEEAYVEVGKDYLRVLPGKAELEAMFQCPVRFGTGRIGERQRALKEWLHSVETGPTGRPADLEIGEFAFEPIPQKADGLQLSLFNEVVER